MNEKTLYSGKQAVYEKGMRKKMKFKSAYLQKVYDGLEARNPEQKEFLEAV